MSEIRYGKATLPACCREIAGRVAEPYQGAFEDICKEYEEGVDVSFQELFAARMEQEFRKLPLKKEDYNCFLSPFRGRGFQDGQMQLKSLEQCLAQLKTYVDRQSGEIRDKSRMSVGLGVMSGLLLVIIMV